MSAGLPWSTRSVWAMVMYTARKQATINGSRRKVSAVRTKSGGWRYLVLCDQDTCSTCFGRIMRARER